MTSTNASSSLLTMNNGNKESIRREKYLKNKAALQQQPASVSGPFALGPSFSKGSRGSSHQQQMAVGSKMASGGSKEKVLVKKEKNEEPNSHLIEDENDDDGLIYFDEEDNRIIPIISEELSSLKVKEERDEIVNC